MKTSMKTLLTLIICLIICTACNSNRSNKADNAADTTTAVEAADTTAETTETAAEATTETTSTDITTDAEAILADIENYKNDFKSGKWDGSPLFIGENVISVDTETAKIWLNNEPLEPLYCDEADNESFYLIDQDEDYVYYLKDLADETSKEAKYFVTRVSKADGSTVSVEIPEETYSAKLMFGNLFVKAKYALYRVDLKNEAPEAILLSEVVSDFEVVDYYSSSELHYITGERIEYGLRIDKTDGSESEITPFETKRARYSSEKGNLTFFDNEIYAKARELYASKVWDGNFIDLHTVESSIPEYTFGSVNYHDNIIINNKEMGKYFRAIQVEPGCNICEAYYSPGLVWFEDDFNDYLHFYFPGQEEEYRVHSYGTTLPNNLSGYTRMIAFYYDSDLTTKTAGARVYILTDGELWFLDCNFLSEQVETQVIRFDDHDVIDFNWAYDRLYYLLDNGEAYTIQYGEVDWDFKNPKRFGNDRLFYALSHHTDEGEGALSLNEGNYGDTHLYSPYGEDW